MLFCKKKNGAIRLRGVAEKNGIAYEAYCVEDGKEVRFQGHMACYDENKITDKVYYGDIRWAGIDYTIEAMNRKFVKKGMIMMLILIGLAFVAAFTSSSFGTIIYKITAVLCGIMLFSEAIVLNRERVKGNSEIKSFLKYLSAMNSVRNAYYKHGRVPSIREAKACRACSAESKYLNNTFFISYLLLLVVYNVIPNVWLTCGALVLLIISFIIERKGKVIIWQRLIYSKPYTYHYKVAIRALEKAIERVNVCQVIDAEGESL